MKAVVALLLAVGVLAGCGGSRGQAVPEVARTVALFPGETPQLRALIEEFAALYDVPVALVHRVVQRESGYRSQARNGPYWGLMQILPQTARTMGHNGPPEELLDPAVNLRYGVKYLRGAWLLSDGDFDTAVGWYARGYYYEAKRRGMLEETGLR